MGNSKRIIALLLCLMLVVAACAPSTDSGTKPAAPAAGATTEQGEKTEPKAAEGDTIKLGGIAPLTGPAAIYGKTTTNAVEMAIEEINAAGGVLGKQIEYIYYDDKGDQTEAVTAYDKLAVEDKVVGIVGAITSKPTLAVAERAVEDNMPMITPTGTQADITPGKANVFRVCFTDPYQGTVLGTYAAETLKAKTAAIMTNNSSDYSDGISKAFAAEAKAKGIEIVAQEGYGDTDKDFRSQLTNISALKPDVLIVPDYYEKDALIAQQAREVGIASVIMGGDGWDGVSKTLDPSAYNVIEGALFTNHYSIMDESENVQSFIKNYKAKYNEDPSAFSALGYDAVKLLVQAIEKAGSTDKQAIVDAMQAIQFDGVTGKLTFDQNGDPIKSVSIIKIVDGVYTFDSSVSAQ